MNAKSKTIRSIAALSVVLVVGTSLVAVGRAVIGSQVAQPKVHWRKNLAAAHEEANRDDKPLLLVFDADWCAYCDKMDSTTYCDPALTTYINNEFVPVRIDLETNKRTAKILSVDRVPYGVALSKNADLLGRVVGYIGSESYVETLTRVRELDGRIERARLAAAHR